MRFPLTADTTRIECLLGDIDTKIPSKPLSFINKPIDFFLASANIFTRRGGGVSALAGYMQFLGGAYSGTFP